MIKKFFLEIKLFLTYIINILIGGIPATLMACVVILALTNEIIGLKDIIGLYILIHIMSTIFLALVCPFDEWEEDYIQESKENNNEDSENEK